MNPQTPALTDEQKKLALKAIRIAMVLVPVVGGALSAWLTGSPFDWVHAVQTVIPSLVGVQ